MQHLPHGLKLILAFFLLPASHAAPWPPTCRRANETAGMTAAERNGLSHHPALPYEGPVVESCVDYEARKAAATATAPQ